MYSARHLMTSAACARYLAGVAVCALAIASVDAEAQETATYTYDALGRLTGANIGGGPNNGIVTGTCYDPAGNRTQYVVASGSGACTSTPTPSPTPSPTPTPTPTPTNQSPVAVADSTSFHCSLVKTLNLVANDYDPDNNVPLSIASVSSSDPGSMWAVIISATSVQIYANASGSYHLGYVIADTLSATGSSDVSITVTGNSGCQEGPPF